MRFLPAAQPNSEFHVIARRRGPEYYVDHHRIRSPASTRRGIHDIGGDFFIRTNSGGRTFRLASARRESTT